MSHFSVLVIGSDVEKQLAPYHEFECTGEDNEYVQDIDITQDLLAEYEKASAETKTSYPTFTEYVSQYHGKNLVKFGKSPDLSDNHAHKYGYALVDAEGNVTKVVDRTNPNKKWDWYQIGGRWNGYFKLKKPHLGALGRPGIQTMDKGYKPPEKDRADVCPKSAIDIEGMRDEAGEAAAKTYDKVAAIIMGHPKPMSWTDMQTKHTVDGKTDWDAARAEYNEQPMVKAFRADDDMFGRHLEDFLIPREEYIQQARDNAIATFAVVREGKWFKRGEMGWWGCVHDEKDKNQWLKEFNQLIDDLPEDTLLTVVDCHI